MKDLDSLDEDHTNMLLEKDSPSSSAASFTVVSLFARIISYPGGITRRMLARRIGRPPDPNDAPMPRDSVEGIGTFVRSRSSSSTAFPFATLPQELCHRTLSNDNQESTRILENNCMNQLHTVCLQDTSLVPFHDLLKTYPTGGTHVKSLTVDFRHWPSLSVAWQLEHIDVLSDIFSTMKTVETLCLRSLLITPSMLMVLSQLPTTVKTLTVSRLVTSRTEHIANVTRAFPFLERLIIEGELYMHPFGVPVPGEQPPPRTLLQRTLDRLRSNTNDPHSELLRESAERWYNCALRGSELMYACGQAGIRDAAGRGLGAILQGPGIGPSLTRLSINYLYWTNTNANFSMARCVNLKHIEFHELILVGEKPMWISSFLCQVETSSVQTISFDVPAWLKFFEWVSNISEPLSRRNFRNLKSIIFNLAHCREAADVAEAFIRSLIPDLDARCLLSFTSG